MDYTPHQIAAALRGECDDPDEMIDIQHHLSRLREQDQYLLRRYGEGLSPQEILKGESGNPQKKFNAALRRLTALANGRQVTLQKSE